MLQAPAPVTPGVTGVVRLVLQAPAPVTPGVTGDFTEPNFPRTAEVNRAELIKIMESRNTTHLAEDY